MKNKNNINLFSYPIEKIVSSVDKDEQSALYKLIDNYENLVESNICNLSQMLVNERNKSIIIYNLSLLLELFLKMSLLKLGISNIIDIGNYGHQIWAMFDAILNKIDESETKRILINIKERISLIKQSNGNKVDYNNYMDFRYNHKKYEYDLIFEGEIDKYDIKLIKETIGCIELVMK